MSAKRQGNFVTHVVSDSNGETLEDILNPSLTFLDEREAPKIFSLG